MTGNLDKLIRYFFTAGTAAVVDVGGFALLRLIPMPIATSAVFSFCAATVVNYLLTSRYVFKHAPNIKAYGLFFLAAVGGMVLNVSVTFVGSVYLGIAPVLAKLAGVGTAFFLNFFLNLRVVFRAAADRR